MKIKFSTFIFIAVFISFILSSCGDDAIDCNEAAINSEIREETEKYSSASSVFVNDPTEDNCNSLLDALDDLIDRFRDLEDCADEIGQGDQFRSDLQEIENDRDLLSC